MRPFFVTMEKITTLIPCKNIKEKVSEIAKAVVADYKLIDEICFVVVLEGARVFAKSLTDEIEKFKMLKLSICYIQLESYGDEIKSTGQVNVLKDFKQDISGKKVLVIDDIVDTGLTLHFLENYLVNKRGAVSVKNCVLLNKPDTRKFNVNISYFGFIIPDRFVVGYGLDHKGLYRGLDYIGYLS